ncbi:hypothetical protein KB206_12455 [Microvirga sp. STS02]|uniref:hypothetical protein n=1 Tax=Hymenobacter negativus TaxID=2795026 RepID=UPI0018DCC684|nr:MULTISPECIES: hypothetical protein [Bacteria]MBH8569698.1 hypothetical protein [Hymenobacter negativus]MBR7209436.1 hypothetical protein [Microvirga sp. STS02]
MNKLFCVLLLATMSEAAHCQTIAPPKKLTGATASAASQPGRATGLPPKFFGTYTYTVYLVYDPAYGQKPTNTRGVGGTLTLGAAGSYEKKLQIPGPYGSYHFDETGRYTIKGQNIEFTYTNSKGKPVTYGGTFSYSEPALSLSMILNQDANGGREVFGLVVKGSESVKRTFNDDGTVKLGS